MTLAAKTTRAMLPVLAMLLAAPDCGEEDPTPAEDGSVAADTTVAPDTATEDTSVVVDTTVAPDTGTEDTSVVADTTVAPDTGEDTATEDTATADSASEDTTEGDSGADTTPGDACTTDAECEPDGWCRALEAGGKACAPFAGLGDSCEGAVAPWYFERCEPALACTFDSEAPGASGTCTCVPECDGRVCGADGCGGSCGGCEVDETCAADGASCVPLPDAPDCTTPRAVDAAPFHAAGLLSDAADIVAPAGVAADTPDEAYLFTPPRDGMYRFGLLLRSDRPVSEQNANDDPTGGLTVASTCAASAPLAVTTLPHHNPTGCWRRFNGCMTPGGNVPTDYGAHVELTLDAGAPVWVLVSGEALGAATTYQLFIVEVPKTVLVDVEATALAADDDAIYWVSPEPAVYRAPVDASAQPSLLAYASEAPDGLRLDATHVWFADPGDGTIKRVPKAGGAPGAVVSGLDEPRLGHVDATHVYWTDMTGLRRRAIAGGDVDTLSTTRVHFSAGTAEWICQLTTRIQCFPKSNWELGGNLRGDGLWGYHRVETDDLHVATVGPHSTENSPCNRRSPLMLDAVASPPAAGTTITHYVHGALQSQSYTVAGGALYVWDRPLCPVEGRMTQALRRVAYPSGDVQIVYDTLLPEWTDLGPMTDNGEALFWLEDGDIRTRPLTTP